MTTTIMRNSRVGDRWIQQMCELNPVQHILDKDGKPTGQILTGPVRLSWIHLFEPAKDKKTGEVKKFGLTALFTPYADFSLFYELYYAELARSFPENYDAGSQQYYGVHSPFHNQAEKLNYGGYTPGCMFLNMSTQFKPALVDTRMNPVVDTSKVYPGVWAIIATNAYTFGKNPPQPKKGVGFGCNTVMIVGDDENLGARGTDPRQAFAAVKAGAPMAAPAAAFAAGPPPGAPGFGPPPTGQLYGQGPGFQPQVPSQGAVPPYAPPLAPVYAPAAPGFAPPPPAADDEDWRQFL